MSDFKKGCLIKESTGALWYLHLKNQRLHYVYKQEKEWTSSKILDEFDFKSFVATHTSDNKVYILAYTYSKQLWLYEWDEAKWKRRNIKNISSKYENVTYISLKHAAGKLHLLFYIDNSLQKARVSLHQHVLSKGVLKSLDSLNFFSDDNVTPLNINIDIKNNLFFIYKRDFPDNSCFYISIYRQYTESWSKQAMLLKRLGLCEGFDSKLDKSGNLHLLWTEKSHKKQALLYKKLVHTNTGFDTGFKELILSTTNKNIGYLSLIATNQTSAFWMEEGKAFSSYIDASFREQPDIKVIDRQPVNPYFTTNVNHNNNNPSLVFGDGYPAFKWNILDLIGNRPFDKGREVQAENKNDSRLQYMQNTLEKIEQSISELYNGLNHLHEYMKERDKSIYSHSTQIKQLSFELEQLGKSRPRNKPASKKDIHTTEIMALEVSDIRDKESYKEKCID
ncbi:MAG TPA: hypothetical protein VFD33_03460, partial [Bacillota bacterium]|nr:hypothetical protein [Bacillota bacterium]